MKCKRCKKEDKQIKAGKTRAGSQVYKCKHCGKTYTPNPKERNYSEEIKRQAIKLYMEENSERAVGRILGISKKGVSNRVSNWKRTHYGTQFLGGKGARKNTSCKKFICTQFFYFSSFRTLPVKIHACTG